MVSAKKLQNKSHITWINFAQNCDKQQTDMEPEAQNNAIVLIKVIMMETKTSFTGTKLPDQSLKLLLMMPTKKSLSGKK